MANEVVTVPLTATAADASKILREGDVSGAPVVDAEGTPVGVISRTDLAAGWEQTETDRRRTFYLDVAREGGERAPSSEFGVRPMSEVMMPLIFSVQQNDSVRKAAALMTAEGIHRVIVLEGKRLVGVLSASAIVAAVARGELTEPT